MLKSMTGYGKAECEFAHKKISIEIKSLNSKQMDLNTRISSLFREKDLEIRRELSEKLIRGKVDFILYTESLGDESAARINQGIVKGYYQQMAQIATELGIPLQENLLPALLGLPEVIKNGREELDDAEWRLVHDKIVEAIAALDKFRIQEGAILKQDLLSNVRSITSLLEEVHPYEAERVSRIREKIYDGLKEISIEQLNENRLEQEMIFYLEKMDINEEKVRLLNHCNYFIETLELKEPVGKKLGFIAQEIGREVNTLGSKANHLEMQKLVIRMKDALERIKEQLLNVL
ncbi:MAG: YicC family protein [Marinilabiliales bacterium]|nr:YicC family protein [Marinilabiliales bacterium]